MRVVKRGTSFPILHVPHTKWFASNFESYMKATAQGLTAFIWSDGLAITAVAIGLLDTSFHTFSESKVNVHLCAVITLYDRLSECQWH